MLGLAVEGLFEGHSLQDGVFGQLDHLHSFLSPHLYSNIILGLSIAFEPKDFTCSMSRRIESPRRQGISAISAKRTRGMLIIWSD